MDYVAVNPDHANDDGLQDIWREMNLAMESVVDDPPFDGQSEDECDHSFIFRDDIGLFCCVCGFIQRSIETIIEFQWNQSMSPMEGTEHGDEVDEAGVVLSEEIQDKKPNGVYVGVEDDEEDKEHSHGNDDGLQDIWREMNMAMECSKVAVVDPPLDGRSEDECDHSFIFRDDIGHFCGVCGFIQRSIETIIDYQIVKIDHLEIP